MNDTRGQMSAGNANSCVPGGEQAMEPPSSRAPQQGQPGLDTGARGWRWVMQPRRSAGDRQMQAGAAVEQQ